MNKKNEYDVIVIGSGISGLACAALLTKCFQQRVLVLEQHFVPGGLTHEFRRKKYSWDVGVHYVGGVEEGSLGRNLFDFISENRLKWEKLPYYFEEYIYPDFAFKVPSNMKRFEKALIREFPEEHSGIVQYFKDVKDVSFWHIMEMALKNSENDHSDLAKKSSYLTWKKLSIITTQKYLNQSIKNKKLKSLLTSQWGNYGVLPDESSFALHALTVYSYFRGAYYPSEGAGQMAQIITKVIEKGGGQVLTHHRVQELIITDGVIQGVSGVLKKDGSSFSYRCFRVVSSIGVRNTQKLLSDQTAMSKLHKIDKKRGYSGVAVYVGLKEDPRTLGFDGKSLWIHPGYNHRENLLKNTSELTKKNPFIFLSFPSLKKENEQHHTAEIITLVRYELFEKWEKTSWRKRGQEYQELKDLIARNFIQVVNDHYPGFESLVDHIEVGTPLTMKHFTNWPSGAFYGLIGDTSRYLHSDQLKVETSIEGLHLTGSDVAAPGIVGAALGGMITAGKISGENEIENFLMKFSPQLKEIFLLYNLPLTRKHIT